jgi:hypothetical protein
MLHCHRYRLGLFRTVAGVSIIARTSRAGPTDHARCAMHNDMIQQWSTCLVGHSIRKSFDGRFLPYLCDRHRSIRSSLSYIVMRCRSSTVNGAPSYIMAHAPFCNFSFIRVMLCRGLFLARLIILKVSHSGAVKLFASTPSKWGNKYCVESICMHHQAPIPRGILCLVFSKKILWAGQYQLNKKQFRKRI